MSQAIPHFEPKLLAAARDHADFSSNSRHAAGTLAAVSDPTTGSTQQIGVTAWSAPNPFGEPTAFVLVHPTGAIDDGTLSDVIADLGLRRLDADGDILPIGTDTLYASLRAQRVELCTADGVWLNRPVTDDWTGNALGRRYIVLAVGTAQLSDDADAAAISKYLGARENVFAALVKIRVRFERG
ncbi:hypothetical protein GCM10027068_20520 [Prescottella soli]